MLPPVAVMFADPMYLLVPVGQLFAPPLFAAVLFWMMVFDAPGWSVKVSLTGAKAPAVFGP